MRVLVRRLAALALALLCLQQSSAQVTGTNTASGGGLPSGGSVGQCLVNTAPGAGGWNSCATGAVSITGTPAAGELTLFSAASTISNGNLSGDCTTTNSLVVTCLKTNNVAFGTFATANSATPPAIGGTTPAAGAFTTLSASGAVSGTGFSTYLASPPAIGGTAAAAGAFTTLVASSTLTTNVTGSTQCLHASTAGVVSGTGSDCGSGGSTAFSALTGSTNTTAAMVVGTGASVGVSGSGTIVATSLSALTGLPTQATATVVANTSGSTAAPTAVALTSFQAAMVAANAILVTDAAPGTGPVNDYSPTGYGTTTAVLYVTPASGGTTLNGLVAGSNMQQVFIVNAEAAGGADLIKLANQSASDTTAANRFLTSATVSLAIPAGGRVDCIYFAGSINRWSCQ